MREFTITAPEAGQRFEKYIKRILPYASTGFIYKMLRRKNITLNGHKADGKEIIAAKDKVTFFFSEETFSKFAAGEKREQAPQDIHAANIYLDAFRQVEQQYHGIRIEWEDDNILIACKPPGLLSQKSKASDVSLNEWFVGYLLDGGKVRQDTFGYFTPSVANRLDRNTGGLVICAKTLQGSRAVSEMLRNRTLHKFYQMIVTGKITGSGTLEGCLIKDHDKNIVTILEKSPKRSDTVQTRQAKNTFVQAGKEVTSSAWQPAGAAPVMTRYKPLCYSANGALTLVEAELITGKTHQLRSQMAAAGHPILGDPKYGKETVNERYRFLGVHHQLLYCVRIEFPDGRVVSTGLPDLYRKVLHCTRQERQVSDNGNMEQPWPAGFAAGRRDQPHQ